MPICVQSEWRSSQPAALVLACRASVGSVHGVNRGGRPRERAVGDVPDALRQLGNGALVLRVAGPTAEGEDLGVTGAQAVGALDSSEAEAAIGARGEEEEDAGALR